MDVDGGSSDDYMDMDESDSFVDGWAMGLGQEGPSNDSSGESSSDSDCDQHDHEVHNFRFPDEFRLIPTAPPIAPPTGPLSEDTSGPGPSTQAHQASRFAPKEIVLNDEDDSRFEVVHPHAGVIKGRRVANAQAAPDGGLQNGIFAPFASNTDWQIAQWAVKDSIGHNSLDRFLSIPGVSQNIASFI